MAAYHAARSSYPPHTYGVPQQQYYAAAADNDAPVIPGVTVTRTRSKSDPHRPGSGGRSRSSDGYIVIPPPAPAPAPAYAAAAHYSTSPPPSYRTNTRQPTATYAYAAPSPPHGHRQPEYHTSHRPHDQPVYAAAVPPHSHKPSPSQDKGYRSKNSYTSSGQEVKYVYANGQPAPDPHAYVPKPKRTPVLFWDEKQRRYREGWMEEDEMPRHHQQMQQQQQQQRIPQQHPLQEEEEEVDWADRPQTPMTYDQLNKRVYAWLDRAEKEHAVGIAPPTKGKPGWMDKLKRGAQYHTGIAA